MIKVFIGTNSIGEKIYQATESQIDKNTREAFSAGYSAALLHREQSGSFKEYLYHKKLTESKNEDLCT